MQNEVEQNKNKSKVFAKRVASCNRCVSEIERFKKKILTVPANNFRFRSASSSVKDFFQNLRVYLMHLFMHILVMPLDYSKVKFNVKYMYTI